MINVIFFYSSWNRKGALHIEMHNLGLINSICNLDSSIFKVYPVLKTFLFQGPSHTGDNTKLFAKSYLEKVSFFLAERA